jgi:AraC-like DNA-binding protein
MKKLNQSFLLSNPDIEFIEYCTLPYISLSDAHTLNSDCYIDIFYILKGPAELMFNTPPSRMLSSGDFIFMNRNHSDYFIVSGSLDAVILHARIIPKDLYKHLLLYQVGYKSMCILNDDNSDVFPAVSELFQLLLKMKKEKSGAILYLETPIALFFVHIYLSEIMESSLPFNSPIHQFSKLMLEIIKNPGYSWNVKDMAKEYCMSTNSFISRFREISGLTPFNFLKKNRLNKGRLLLENTHIPVSVIARRCGYNSQASFSFYIKQEFGHTPLKLRSNAEINNNVATPEGDD